MRPATAPCGEFPRRNEACSFVSRCAKQLEFVRRNAPGTGVMNSMSKPAAIKMPIPFIDLQAQRRRLGESVDQGMRRVLNHGQFIMGPEVPALETALSAFCGAHHVIGCANEPMP